MLGNIKLKVVLLGCTQEQIAQDGDVATKHVHIFIEEICAAPNNWMTLVPHGLFFDKIMNIFKWDGNECINIDTNKMNYEEYAEFAEATMLFTTFKAANSTYKRIVDSLHQLSIEKA